MRRFALSPSPPPTWTTVVMRFLVEEKGNDLMMGTVSHKYEQAVRKSDVYNCIVSYVSSLTLHTCLTQVAVVTAKRAHQQEQRALGLVADNLIGLALLGVEANLCL